MPSLRDYPQYWRFWFADTISILGTQVTGVALLVVAVDQLHATNSGVGFLNAARWAPYLLLGLLAGALTDRMRRRPILVAADFGRAALLTLIPLLFLAELLRLPALIALMFVFGIMSLFYEAAYQSYVPRLVPVPLLTTANARLIQSESVATLSGPLLAGFLLKVAAAPIVLLIDVASYLVSGTVVARLRVTEPGPPGGKRDLRREIREGLSWVYRHTTLAPIALTNHVRFLFSSMVVPIYGLFVLRDLQLGPELAPIALGTNAAFAAVGSVAGSAAAHQLGLRLGTGWVIVLARFLVPVATFLLVFSPAGTTGWVMLAAMQFVYGLCMGAEAPSDMGYRNAVTRDRLRGRMNATIRSMNWGLYAVGSAAGGVLADTIGYQPALGIAITGMLLASVALAASPGRHATMDHTAGMKFRSTIILGGKTATGFEVPEDVVTALGAGKRPPVHVKIGDYAYRSTVAPMGGQFWLPLAAEHRTAIGAAAGDEIEVEVALDTEPRVVEVPQDFASALDQIPAARAAFEKLSYSHKRQHVLAIEDAKTPETRQRRIAKAVDTLSS